MGRQVLEFNRLHPDTGPGFASAVARLQERLARADQLARQQYEGRSEVHAATARKRKLRQVMRSAHLDHLINVAQIASVEQPEVLEKFAFSPDITTYLAFQTAAASMAAEAESRKEFLTKHGLSEEVVTALRNNLDEFETAVEQGAAGRLAHVGASAELITVSDDIVQVVKVMNGMVQLRYVNQPEVLAAWEAASSVFATPRPEKPVSGGSPTPVFPAPPGGGEARPAA